MSTLHPPPPTSNESRHRRYPGGSAGGACENTSWNTPQRDVQKFGGEEAAAIQARPPICVRDTSRVFLTPQRS